MPEPFDIDEFIADMSDGLAEKQAKPPLSKLGLARRLIEQKIQRVQHNQEAVEKTARSKAKPLRYDEQDAAKKIILPPGAKK